MGGEVENLNRFRCHVTSMDAHMINNLTLEKWYIMTKQTEQNDSTNKKNYLEWCDYYERKYNFMPAWWWNDYMRKKEYKHYLDGYST